MIFGNNFLIDIFCVVFFYSILIVEVIEDKGNDLEVYFDSEFGFSILRFWCSLFGRLVLREGYMFDEIIKVYVIEVDEVLYSLMEEDDLVFSNFYRIYGKFLLMGVFFEFFMLVNL